MASGERPLVGLVAAAGLASRLPDIEGSKELLEVPDGEGGERPVITVLLSALGRAGVERVFVVLRTGKWDIPSRLADNADLPPIAYLATHGTASIPASLDVAHPFTREATVVSGFADSCFAPLDGLRMAVERHRSSDAAVTLALFASDRPDKTDMVEVDGDRVIGLRVKPGPCDLELTFGGLVWSPAVTELMHGLLADETWVEAAAVPHRELQVSHLLEAVLREGWVIDSVRPTGGRYVDVGTPEDLERIRRREVSL